MSNLDNGGPAFPCDGFQTQTGDVIPVEGISGMSLRDYFAAKAMASVWRDIPDDANRQQALDYLGECAYEMADAMLKARQS